MLHNGKAHIKVVRQSLRRVDKFDKCKALDWSISEIEVLFKPRYQTNSMNRELLKQCLGWLYQDILLTGLEMENLLRDLDTPLKDPMMIFICKENLIDHPDVLTPAEVIDGGIRIDGYVALEPKLPAACRLGGFYQRVSPFSSLHDFIVTRDKERSETIEPRNLRSVVEEHLALPESSIEDVIHVIPKP